MDLKCTIDEFTNPFADECDHAINMVTKAVLPERIIEETNERIEIGKENVSLRKTTNVLCAPIKKT